MLAEPTHTERDLPLIRVLAAVISDGDRYLVCQRPAHKRHGGLWEFPGGKLEPGESLLEAADREMQEELCVRAVSVGTPLLVVRDSGSSFLIEFVPVEIEGKPLLREHEDLRWAALEEIEQLALAPSDRNLVRFFLDHR